MTKAHDITALLAQVSSDQEDAVQVLMPILYEELNVLARHQLRQFRPGDTLNTTALVHEAYFKLIGRKADSFPSRRHFFALAAKAMRQVVVDYARKQRAQKRNRGAEPISLDDLQSAVLKIEAQADSLLALNQALTRLSSLDERLAQVVELRFFGGLSVEETADVLGVSAPTVKRDTRAARAFLYREIGPTAEA